MLGYKRRLMTEARLYLVMVVAMIAAGCNRNGQGDGDPGTTSSGADSDSSSGSTSTTGSTTDSTDSSGDESEETADTGEPCADIDEVFVERTEWRKEFDLGAQEVGTAIAFLADGTAVVAGTAIGSGKPDLFVAAHSADGTEEWSWIQDFGGTDAPKTIHATNDGGFVVAGNVGEPGRAWVGKYDATGQLDWEAFPGVSVGEPEEEFGLADAELGPGGKLGVLGVTTWDPGGDDSFKSRGWLVEVDAAGADAGTIWTSDEVAPTELGIADAAYLLSLNATGNPGIDGLIRALEDDGTTAWDATFDAHEMDGAPVYGRGSSPVTYWGSSGYPSGDADALDGSLGVVSADGEIGWSRDLGYCGQDFLAVVRNSPGKGPVVLQQHWADPGDALTKSGVVRAFDEAGAELWAERIPDVDDGAPNSMALSGDGFAFVVGVAGSGGEFDYYLAKIAL